VKDGSRVRPLSVYPFLLTGMTDSRWYHEIAPGRIVRFSPFALSFDELSMIHGTDERVAVSEYLDAVRFYHHLIYSSSQDMK
jgi:carboxypeptidase PM20D1